MADLKINGNTYTGVEQVKIPLADGSGNALFSEGSGSGEVVNGTLLATLDADTTVTDFLTNHPIPRAHEKSTVWVKVVGDTAATSGSGTVNWFAFICNTIESAVQMGKHNCVLFNYKNGLVAPSDMSFFATISAQNGNYFAVSGDGSITASTLTITPHYLPAGAKIYYLEIPFDYIDFLLAPFS